MGCAYEDILSHHCIETAMTVRFDRDAVREAIETGETTYLIAERHGVAVGYLQRAPSIDDSVATLAAIHVTLDRWMEGIGIALLYQFEESCR